VAIKFIFRNPEIHFAQVDFQTFAIFSEANLWFVNMTLKKRLRISLPSKQS